MTTRIHRIDYTDDIVHAGSNHVRFRVLPSSIASSVTGDPWPRYTSIACWNCDRNFQNPPCGIPRSVQRDVIDVHGTFCSMACLFRFLEDHPTPDAMTQRAWALRLARDHWNIDTREGIRSAPSRFQRVLYGGTLTDEEFEQLVCASKLREIARANPPQVITTPLSVRELYFGAQEFGRGEDAILEHIGTVESGSTAIEYPSEIPSWVSLYWCGRPQRHWPRSSPFLCWHCGLSFTSPPVMIPSGARNAQGRIPVDGNYCSVACGLRVLIDSTDHVRSERIGCMMWLARCLYNFPLNHGRFPVAPSRFQRVRFGGDLDDEEFRIQCVTPDLLTSIETPPFLNVDRNHRPREMLVRDMQRLGSHVEDTFEEEQKYEREELPAQPGLFANFVRELQESL